MPASMPKSTSRIKIYQQLRREIIIGHRQSGDRLSVTILANEFGTSVTPVRDALQMLGQEGLVTIRPRSGYFIVHMTLKQLQDLFALREILEIAAVRLAAMRMNDQQIDKLAGIHAGYTGDDDDSYYRYTDENREFHYQLAKGSGNDELARLIKNIHDRLARFMVIRHGGAEQVDTHARLIQRLKQKDADGACRAIQREMADTRETVLNRVLQNEAGHWVLGRAERTEN
jgi:DNA-binding GntR family transcriptional regulator